MRSELEYDPKTEIRGFEDWRHYFNHRRQLESSPNWIPVDADPAEPNVGQVTHWFKHLPTGEIWRLAKPDPPSTGWWGKYEPLPM